MIFGIIFVIEFMIGFVAGIATPFILKRLDIYNLFKTTKNQNDDAVSSDVKQLINEWQNGIDNER